MTAIVMAAVLSLLGAAADIPNAPARTRDAQTAACCEVPSGVRLILDHDEDGACNSGLAAVPRVWWEKAT